MSFMHTTKQVKNRSKTVTRRLGWKNLKPGDLIQACEKCRGLKKGEIKKLAVIRVVSNRREPLTAIDQEDCAREGYPDRTPAQFVVKFCQDMKVLSGTIVNRIEFEYVGSPGKTSGGAGQVAVSKPEVGGFGVAKSRRMVKPAEAI